MVWVFQGVGTSIFVYKNTTCSPKFSFQIQPGSVPFLSRANQLENQNPALWKCKITAAGTLPQSSVNGRLRWTETLFKGVWIGDRLRLGRDRQHLTLPEDQV